MGGVGEQCKDREQVGDKGRSALHKEVSLQGSGAEEDRVGAVESQADRVARQVAFGKEVTIHKEGLTRPHTTLISSQRIDAFVSLSLSYDTNDRPNDTSRAINPPNPVAHTSATENSDSYRYD